MPFDIAAARKDGLSDTDIAEHLAKSAGFNIEAARKDGISDKEIAEHLASTAGRPRNTQAATANDNSLAKQAAAGLAEGVVGIPGQTPRLAEAIGSVAQPLLEKIGLASPEAETKRQELKALIASQPNSVQSYEKAVSDAFPQPAGPVGKFIRAGARTVPGAVAGIPGSPVKAAVIGAGAGLGSEAGGQLAEGTPYEIPASIAGGLLGGGAVLTATARVGTARLVQQAARTAETTGTAPEAASASSGPLRDALHSDTADTIAKEGGLKGRALLWAARKMFPQAESEAAGPTLQPWNTPTVRPDTGYSPWTAQPWPNAPTGPGVAQPKLPWSAPQVSEVPPMGPINMGQGPQPLALPEPAAVGEAMPLIRQLAAQSKAAELAKTQAGARAVLKDMMPSQPLLPKPAWFTPQVTEVPPMGPISLPGPVSAAAEINPVATARAITKAKGKVTVTPKTEDDLAIPAFLKRGPDNKVQNVAPEAAATPELPTAPEGSPHYIPGDLKATIASAQRDFLTKSGLDPNAAALPPWLSKSNDTIARIFTEKANTADTLTKQIPGFDTHDFLSRYIHSRSYAGGEQLKARMKAQYPGYDKVFDEALSNKVFSTIYTNKTSSKDGTRAKRK